MIKNTASQKVGVQMVSATDGSAFTGSVTVAVTGDAGTQATGSVGSGACTHEGNGYHSYAPSQAETNYDLVAFTFTGTGAVPQTVQIYTRAATPDVNVAQISGDSTAADNLEAAADGSGYNLGGGSVVAASVTAGVTVSTNNDKTGYALSAAGVDAIWDEAQSGNTTAGTFGLYLDSAVSGVSTGGVSAADIADAVWDEARSGHTTSGTFGEGVKVESLNTQAKADVNAEADTALTDYGALKPTTAGRTLDVTATGEAGIDWANIGGKTTTNDLSGTTISTSQAVASVSGAVASVTGNVGGNVTGSVGSLATQAKADVNAEVLDVVATDVIADSVAADGSRPTMRQALLMITRFLMERSVSSTTVTVTKEDGSTSSMTFTLDDDTSPTSITRAS